MEVRKNGLLGGWMERWIDVWTDGLIDKFPLKGHLNSYSVPFGETDEYADSCTLP